MTVILPGQGYLKRYEENDEGLRYQDLTYLGNYTDLAPSPTASSVTGSCAPA